MSVIGRLKRQVLLAAVFLFLLSGCHIRLATKDDWTSAVPTGTPFPSATAASSATPVSGQCFWISITGPDGPIVEETELQYEADRQVTVFEVLQDLCERSGISLNYSGSLKRNTVYVQAIDDIWEKAYGGSSGWLYYVNESFASVGVSSYILEDGDVIEWKYTRG